MTAETPPGVQHRLSDLYEAYNRRDVAAVLAAMTPDVVWPNGWLGGSMKGRDQVREFWTRQWAEVDPTAEPVGFRAEQDGRTAVSVHQIVRDRATGSVVTDEQVVHVYRFVDGLVSDMEIRHTGLI